MKRFKKMEIYLIAFLIALPILMFLHRYSRVGFSLAVAFFDVVYFQVMKWQGIDKAFFKSEQGHRFLVYITGIIFGVDWFIFNEPALGWLLLLNILIVVGLDFYLNRRVKK